MSLIPEWVPHGVMTADFGEFVSDPNRAQGTVWVTPSTPIMRWPGQAKTLVLDTHECPLIDGVLYPPGTTRGTMGETTPGVPLVATVQADATPPLVTYRVYIRVDGASTLTHLEEAAHVPDGGTVDLGELMSGQVVFPPGTVVITDVQDRELAVQASRDAFGYATSAGVSAVESGVARNQAVTAKEQAEDAYQNIRDLGTWTTPDGDILAVVRMIDGRPTIRTGE